MSSIPGRKKKLNMLRNSKKASVAGQSEYERGIVVEFGDEIKGLGNDFGISH